MSPSSGGCAAQNHVAKFLHLNVELGVKIVPVPCFRLSYVDGELLDAITQSSTFLMESSLGDEEVIFVT
jgi:hypothetical protein